MDPNETLKQIRELATTLLARADAHGGDESTEALMLAELIDGLDNWRLTGGFLPADWLQGGRVTDAQGLAFADLLRRFKDDGASAAVGAAGLPDSYLHVVLRPSGFECGIDAEGRVSS